MTTVDDIIANRLKLWFPTLDIGAAVDIAKVRKDLESLAASVKAELLAEGQATKATLLKAVETLPRYEPELRGAATLTDEAVDALAEMFEQWRQEGSNLELLEVGQLGDKHALGQRLLGWAGPLVHSEAVMIAKPAGESASFVAIQDLRRVLA